MMRRSLGQSRFGKIAISAMLSVLLLLQTTFAAITPASQDGVQIVICGAGGLQTITLNPDGTLDTDDQGRNSGANCPFCIVGLCAEATPAAGVSIVRLAFRMRPAFGADQQVAPLRVARLRAIRAPPRTA